MLLDYYFISMFRLFLNGLVYLCLFSVTFRHY